MPVTQPTSCEFGGTDLATLYVTSARMRLDDAALAANRSPAACSSSMSASRLAEPRFRRGVRGMSEDTVDRRSGCAAAVLQRAVRGGGDAGRRRSARRDAARRRRLRGVASHGVVRVPIYVQRLRCGVIAPRRRCTSCARRAAPPYSTAATRWVRVAGQRAMELAVAKARDHGDPVFVSVRNSNHFGAAAWFVEIAARANMVGLRVHDRRHQPHAAVGRRRADARQQPVRRRVSAPRTADRARHGVLGCGARQDHRRGEGRASRFPPTGRSIATGGRPPTPRPRSKGSSRRSADPRATH